MHILKSFLLVQAASGVALAQSVNIEWGQPGSSPPSTYGAAGQPGVWNTLDATQSFTFSLVGLDGLPIAATIRNIGGSALMHVDDPSTSGDDAALLDDCLTSLNNPLDACLFVQGLENGVYEVTIYAWGPGDPSLVSPVRIDQNTDPSVDVGGAWGGAHAQGVTYMRQLAEVTQGRMEFHSGTPSGNFRSVINGVQLRLLSECPADLNGDGVVSGADLAILLGEWGECPPGAPCPADVTGNGTVDGADLATLLGDWGECG